jgi:hypothetical protein
MHRIRTRASYLILLLVVTLVGCVSDGRPGACDADELTIEMTVTATALEPDDPAACGDQAVTLVIDSEVDGIFHIHGLDAVLPATPISAGETLTLQFDATTSGQFPVELHPADDPQGVTIGILTIHER